MESSNALLESKKRQLETVKNALKDLSDALESDHYKNDYLFVSPPNAASELKQPFLKSLAQRLNDKGLGFDPSLIIQHIEKELLRQFNEEVEMSIKGQHSSKLMAHKHELEVFDIKDRLSHFTGKLEELEKEILSLIAPTQVETEEKVTKKATKKK